jgi:transketolase
MKLLIQAQVSQPSPAYIRFGKGGESIVSEGLATNNDRSISYLGSIQAAKVIVTTGVALQPSLLAVMNLLNDDDVLLVHFTKVNLEFSDLLNSILDNKETVLVVEEHQSLGGLLTQILHYCHEYRLSSETIRSISLGKAFVRNYGSQADHFKTFGITPENIANELMR